MTLSTKPRGLIKSTKVATSAIADTVVEASSSTAKVFKLINASLSSELISSAIEYQQDYTAGIKALMEMGHTQEQAIELLSNI